MGEKHPQMSCNIIKIPSKYKEKENSIFILFIYHNTYIGQSCLSGFFPSISISVYNYINDSICLAWIAYPIIIFSCFVIIYI